MRVLNKKYWPVCVTIDYDYRLEDDIYNWCVENLPAGFKIIGSKTYYFRSESDATLFSLRWA